VKRENWWDRQAKWIGRVLHHDSLVWGIIEDRILDKRPTGRPRHETLDYMINIMNGKIYVQLKEKAQWRENGENCLVHRPCLWTQNLRSSHNRPHCNNKHPTGCEVRLTWKCLFTATDIVFGEGERLLEGLCMQLGFLPPWLTQNFIFTSWLLWPWKVGHTKDESVSWCTHVRCTYHANLVTVKNLHI